LAGWWGVLHQHEVFISAFFQNEYIRDRKQESIEIAILALTVVLVKKFVYFLFRMINKQLLWSAVATAVACNSHSI